MKELKRKMPHKAKPKKKVKQSLTQKEKFIAYAKEVEADETGERFNRALEKIKPKRD
jgi:hypothetical protein